MAFDLAKEIGKEIVYTTAGVGSLLPLIGLTRANSQAFNPASLTIKMERLIFPADLANYPLSMCFDIHKYERRSMFKQPKLPIKGQIRLPVAKNIQDSFSADWNAENQSPIVGAAVENLLKGGPITDPQSILDQSMNIAGTVVGGLVGAGGGALVEASKRVPPLSTFISGSMAYFKALIIELIVLASFGSRGINFHVKLYSLNVGCLNITVKNGFTA